MRYGVTMFATDLSIDVVELARAVEERGLDCGCPSTPTSPPAAAPRTPAAPSCPRYKRSLDAGRQAAASATTTLRLGTGILCRPAHSSSSPPRRSPRSTTCQGPAALGVGFGWNEDEMADHGVAYRRRRATREHVLAMQALWRDEAAEFTGEHVSPPAWSWPKPAQRDREGRPSVPVLMGGGAGPSCSPTPSSTPTAGCPSVAPA